MPEEELPNNTSPEPTPLSKAERKQLKRSQRLLEQQQVLGKQKRKRLFLPAVAVVILLIGAAWLVWKIIGSSPVPVSDIVSKQKIHWHAHLAIRIKGKDITIPANVGITVGEVHPERMHTHETDNIIHIEKRPPVLKDDIKLKNFFEVWGETLTPDCVLDSCNIDKGTLTMTVNGQENHDFGDYLMREGDKIVLDYE